MLRSAPHLFITCNLAMLRSLPVLLAALLAAGSATAQDNAPAAAAAPAAKVFQDQTACPVSGEPIDEETFVDYEGHRVYFCCENCSEKFAAFPDAWLYKMYKAGVQPENTQTTCVVSGMELENRDNFVQVLNKRIYTCCGKCAKKVSAEPAVYLDKMEGRTAQKACPVMGGPVDKEVSSVVQGQKVYYCCAKCSDKMAGEPDKYFGRLAEAKAVTEPASMTCMVMGDPVEDKKHFVTYQGRRYYFCCEKCISAFTKKPAKWVAKL